MLDRGGHCTPPTALSHACKERISTAGARLPDVNQDLRRLLAPAEWDALMMFGQRDDLMLSQYLGMDRNALAP